MGAVRRLSLSFLSLAVVASSQEFHPPGEIMKLIESSPIDYALGFFDSPPSPSPSPSPTARKGDLNPHGVYIRREGKTIQLKSYEDSYREDPVAWEAFTEGDRLFDEGKLAEARDEYRKVLDRFPGSSQMMTYIGQSLGLDGDHASARSWYERALVTNAYDYLAHLLLADSFLHSGALDQALEHVLTARVLNRNNPRIREKLVEILTARSERWQGWELSPVFEITKTADGQVRVLASQYQPEWLDYAACKALWEHEPGYREAMTEGQSESPRVVEEKECLANFVLAAQTDEPTRQRHAVLIEKILEATRKGQLSALIVYEILLPEDPTLVFQLDESSLDRLVDYVKEFRIEAHPRE